MSNPILDSFEDTMKSLDKMIFDLETNLGKNHSKSPFDDLRVKFGGQAAAKSEEPDQIKDAPAPQKGGKQQDNAQKGAAQGGKKDKKEKKPKQAAPPKEEASNLSKELEWFDNCDLRVGKIVECKECEGSDKLYIEKVDLGEGKLRDIGSGVRQFCTMD